MVGVVGQPASGKSTAGRYLAQKFGFHEFGGSDYLREEAANRGIVLRKREDYAQFQRYLRLNLSACFMADAAFGLLGTFKRVAHLGIRNRFDVDAHRSGGGVIIALDCPVEIRFSRRDCNDPKYPDNFDDFIAAEAAEYDDPDPLGMHTIYAIERAHYRIDTSAQLEESRAHLDEIMAIHVSRVG